MADKDVIDVSKIEVVLPAKAEGFYRKTWMSLLRIMMCCPRHLGYQLEQRWK